MWIYLNDRFVKEEEAVVSVFDHGFLYGDGVYETIRSYGSRIFMRDQHLARLRRSADAIGLTIPIPEHRWPSLLHEAMTRNDLGHEQADAYLRITISRGAGDIGLDPDLCPTPTVVIMTIPYRREPDRRPNETELAQRALASDQGHKLFEQYPGQAGSDRGRCLRQHPAQLGIASDGMHRQQSLFRPSRHALHSSACVWPVGRDHPRHCAQPRTRIEDPHR